MTEEELRLQCVQMALSYGHMPDKTLEIAQTLFEFIANRSAGTELKTVLEQALEKIKGA